jgi:hypothetical protein
MRVPLCGQVIWVLMVLVIYRGWLYFNGQLRNIDLCVLFVVDSVTSFIPAFSVFYILWCRQKWQSTFY